MKKMRRNLGQEAEWRRHIEEIKKSGESVREYCRKNGITECRFFYWRRRLTGGGSRASRGKAASRFNRAKIIAAASEGGASTLSLRLPNGARIEFTGEPKVEWVLDILKSIS